MYNAVKGCLAGKNKKRGFTLIELLVVVLIIGILATVAVPQYQKTVEKSRVAEAVTVLNSLYKNYELCLLQDEAYNCSRFENLTAGDIGIPGTIFTSSCSAQHIKFRTSSDITYNTYPFSSPCIITSEWSYSAPWSVYGVIVALRTNGDYHLSKLLREWYTPIYNAPIYCFGTGCKNVCGADGCIVE